MTARTETWLAALQAEGGRLTAPRRAVVEIMATTDRLLDPQLVYDLARHRRPTIGLVTVYRTLERLEQLGLIERVHTPSGCHAFVRAGRGQDHLLLCQACGRVERFSGDDLNDLKQAIAERTGYVIREHWLQLYGVCRACQV
jgi:Fe2+ or Zn2+ uptake regulation protein